MRLSFLAVAAVCLLAMPASAQMMMPPLGPPTAAEPPAEEAPAAAPRRARPRKPTAAAAVTIVNNTATAATEVVISADDKSATLSKPVPPKGRAALKLPRIKGCVVQVAVTFEDGAAEPSDFDVCKEKVIRLTE